MHWPLVPRAAARSLLIALATAALLPGCACDPHRGAWHPTGDIETKGDQPFTLSTKDQKLVIAPGSLNITPIENDCAPRLEIANGSGRLSLALHRGELTRNEIRIVGVTHGLSANILGTWRDISQQRPHDVGTTESCTASGYCNHQETEKECHDGKCKTETHTEYGYYANCPGWRQVTIHYDDFKRRYELAFLNPRNTNDALGRYTGTTPDFTLEVGRDSGSCRVN